MVILFVAPEYLKKGKASTGFPNYLNRVTQALAELGNEIIVVSFDTEVKEFVYNNVYYYVIPRPINNFNWGKYSFVLNNLALSYAINKKVKEICTYRHIDIIQFPSLQALSMFYVGRVPSVFRLSSYTKKYFESHETYDTKFINILSFMERIAASRCNAVIAPSHVMAETFGADTGRKVKVVESPFVNDVKEYDYKVYNEYLRNKKYVLFFGTLYAEKGILVIGKILNEFLKNNPEYFYVFCGKAENIHGKNAKKILMEAAGKYGDRVLFFEQLRHEQLYPIIQRADFVTLPSLMDNFPNACIEAMFFKKVVIGTNGASFEQLIEHKKSGFLCKIGDSKDLLEKMQMVVEMHHDSKALMQEEAGKRIEHLKPERVVTELVKTYDTIIKFSKVKKQLGVKWKH